MAKKTLKNLRFGDKEILLGRGLKALALKNGSTAFILAKKLNGKLVRHTLGHHPDMSLNDAEEIASKYRKLIEEGVHPRDWEQEQRDLAEAQRVEDQNRTRTLRELLSAYERWKEGKNVDDTIKDRRWAVNSQYADYMDQPLSKITYEVVDDVYHNWCSQEGAKDQANKCARYMRAMWNSALLRKWVTENPFLILQDTESLTTDKQNDEYLELDEVHRLLETIGLFQNPAGNENKLKKVLDSQQYNSLFKPARQAMVDSIALELLTGIRKREMLSLPWSQVHLPEYEIKDGFIHWEKVDPDHPPYFQFKKSKQKEWMGIPITEQMLPYFQRRFLLRTNDWVFPSPRKKDSPLYNNDEVYELINLLMPRMTVAKKVGSTQLRNTFATTGYRLGYTFEQIGLFTGHISAIKNTKVATIHYVAIDAEHHRYGFEDINRAFVGLLDRELLPVDAVMPERLEDAKTWDERIEILEEGIDDLSEDAVIEGMPEFSPREFREMLVTMAKASKIDGQVTGKFELSEKKKETRISPKRAMRNRSHR